MQSEKHWLFRESQTKRNSKLLAMMGVTVVSAEDDESDRYEIRIEPMDLRPPGSEETPDDEEGEEGEEGEEEEDEDKGEDESDEESFEAEDLYAAIKAAQQKFGGVLKMCKGAGCGEPLCFSCWPQREKDWGKFPTSFLRFHFDRCASLSRHRITMES